MEKSKTYPRMSDQDIFQLIAEELRILPQQVQNTVELLDEENTIPFIARYRKEVTGKLNEEQIRFIQTEVNYFRALEERKQTVLRSIDEQGKLTSDLLQKIVKACKLQEVEDLYLPYRPRRKTRGSIAKARGLEPLADLMWEQKIETGDVNEYAAVYVNAEKEVFSVEEALQGAGDIVAERISDDAEVRQMLRKIFHDEGVIVTQAKDSSVRSDYEMYYDYKEAVRKIVPHRILAINRGETEGFLRVKIDVERESVIRQISQHVIS
ncbi:RNA-binding transcriptional accessory protein, partial [candidate division KSB1 bacterium]